MLKKPAQLVLLFALLFAVLIGIQVYFLMNSYALKEREIFSQVKLKLNDLEEDLHITDEQKKDDAALVRFINLENGNISEATLGANYKVLSDQIYPRLSHYVDSLFAPSGYQVKVYKEIISVYSHNKKKELIQQPILFYKSASILHNKQLLFSSKWETSTNKVQSDVKNGVDKEMQVQDYAYTVKMKSYFEISNIQTILFRELYLLILISIILLTAILFVFYRSYKNLMEQRRQIENLHDMVDNVAHELRTPVATLKVISRTLEKTHPSDVVQIFGRQVDRLELILQPLTATITTELGAIFVQQHLDSYMEDFRFSNPNILIDVNCLPDKNLILSKEDMETILSNLLGNSVKYGAKSIKLHFISDEHIFRMTVEDDGKGINKEDQPYIFEKFYRIQKDNIHESKGMGLGLYIVVKLLEKYKGKIWIDSAVAEGTTFQISIPHD